MATFMTAGYGPYLNDTQQATGSVAFAAEFVSSLLAAGLTIEPGLTGVANYYDPTSGNPIPGTTAVNVWMVLKWAPAGGATPLYIKLLWSASGTGTARHLRSGLIDFGTACSGTGVLSGMTNRSSASAYSMTFLTNSGTVTGDPAVIAGCVTDNVLIIDGNGYGGAYATVFVRPTTAPNAIIVFNTGVNTLLPVAYKDDSPSLFTISQWSITGSTSDIWLRMPFEVPWPQFANETGYGSVWPFTMAMGASRTLERMFEMNIVSENDLGGSGSQFTDVIGADTVNFRVLWGQPNITTTDAQWLAFATRWE